MAPTFRYGAGAVELTCTAQPTGELTDCTVTYETQPESGLGDRVLEAVGPARLSPVTADGAAQATSVRFGVRFRGGTSLPVISQPLPPAPDGVPLLITEISWSRPPRPEFPERAMARGQQTGEATIRCSFIASGDVTDCETVSESPVALGFASAAMAGARRGQLAEAVVLSAPEGSKIQIVTRFTLRQ